MNDTISLSFPKSIYSAAVIRRAVQDYQSICRVRVCETVRHFICTFSNSAANPALTAREFANYLIELSNAQGAGL